MWREKLLLDSNNSLRQPECYAVFVLLAKKHRRQFDKCLRTLTECEMDTNEENCSSSTLPLTDEKKSVEKLTTINA